MDTEGQRLSESNIVSAKIVHSSVERQCQRGGCSRQDGSRGEAAAPAAIASVNQCGDLAQLALGEIHFQTDGSISKLGRCLETALHPERARVTYRDVRSHGAGLEPDAPLVFRFQPQRKVCI
jgi:hypothetical protein